MPKEGGGKKERLVGNHVLCLVHRGPYTVPEASLGERGGRKNPEEGEGGSKKERVRVE